MSELRMDTCGDEAAAQVQRGFLESVGWTVVLFQQADRVFFDQSCGQREAAPLNSEPVWVIVSQIS